MIANLLTALRGQRSSRRYVGRHRLPESPTPADDGAGTHEMKIGVELIANDGTQTVVLPQLASTPVDRRP